MTWATLLHFYQPYGQKREIIDAIVHQSYRPIAEALLANDHGKLNINFTGVLLDQLDEFGYREIIEMYAEAARLGRIELVGSSKYHTIMPLLPAGEAARQLEINNVTSQKYFGDSYQPKGVFLPEMAYSPALAPIIEAAGFEYVLLDELAYNGKVNQVDSTKAYEIEGTKLRALFREHRLSATLMSAGPRDIDILKAATLTAGKPHVGPIITAMDGETFGHHRIGHEQLLFAMLRDPDINTVRLSDLLDGQTPLEVVPTVSCTWASNEADLEAGIPYISWDDPTNDIHKLQWELLKLAANEVSTLSPRDAGYGNLRAKLDYAISSDQFFWAASRPWWMIEHIERGAFDLLSVIEHTPGVASPVAEHGLNLYHEIMSLAYDWQRTGKLDQRAGRRADLVRVPFKEKTLEKGETGTWEAFLHLLDTQEKTAAKRHDYEAAILWRDARYKLEHKLDIYDSIYVIDLLHSILPKGEIDETVAKYQAQYDHIRGGQVEQRSN